MTTNHLAAARTRTEQHRKPASHQERVTCHGTDLALFPRARFDHPPPSIHPTPESDSTTTTCANRPHNAVMIMADLGFFGMLASLIVLAISVVLSILISQPFTGALVRLRANYLPKAVSLDNVLEDGALAAEAGPNPGHNGSGGGVSPRTISAYFLRERQQGAKIGPVISGIVAMLIRTRRLEGWAGIYKGSAPVICQLVLLGFLHIIFFNAVGGLGGSGAYQAAPSGPGRFHFWTNLFFMLSISIIALPLNVVTNRCVFHHAARGRLLRCVILTAIPILPPTFFSAIVHPRTLTFNRPRDNLRELLSYSEFSQPWRLFTLPGLLAAQICHIVWIGFATRIVRHLTVPSLGGLPASTPAAPDQDTYSGPSSDGNMTLSAFGLTVFLAWCVLSVVVLSPLECVIVRLSVQRPERQQPLHIAYARVPTSGASSSGPASYNNQAQVQQTLAQQDNDQPARTQLQNGQNNSTAPTDPLPRPSFAIEDEDDEEGTPGPQHQSTQKSKPANGKPASEAAGPKQDGAAQTLPETAAQAPSHGALPSRTLGGQQDGYRDDTHAHFASRGHSGMEPAPSEPVIALRPCDEPQSAEEAARAEAEGFGAPTVERYQGMVDCVNKLVDEEGVEALYRGAWVTLLFMLAGNFA